MVDPKLHVTLMLRQIAAENKGDFAAGPIAMLRRPVPTEANTDSIIICFGS
jgi:hypothetical protein